MGHTDLGVREGRGADITGRHRDRGHRTEITTQTHHLPTQVSRVLLDRLRVPNRRGARDRAGEVNKEGDHAPSTVQRVQVDLVRVGARPL